LRWADLQLHDGRVTLHFRKAKGGKVMADLLPIPVGQTLLTWLHRFYGAEIGALSPEAPLGVSLSRNSRGRPLSVRSVATICAERLGVSKVHALRHTFARTMEDAGAKVSEIQERLGHSSLATTGRYLAALRRAENAHADELARRFGLDEE
jgi:integrase/recombinase XerD